MRPIQARISIGAMAHNLRVARSHAGATRVFAVVKANAYGHGLSRARRALAAADGFAVLTLEEAANLRLMGVDQPILLLEGFFGVDEIATCAELDLWPVLHHPAHLDGCSSNRLRGPCRFSSNSTAACTGWDFHWPIMPPSSRGREASAQWPASR